MRITGGADRGRVIKGPSGREARPTAAKIRQAFFNILGPRVTGCRFLDLFAGCGLVGIEALSRGAAELVAVEENHRLAEAVQSNLLGLGYQGKIITGDARRVLPGLAGDRFDVVFADPPYRSELAQAVLKAMSDLAILAPDGILVIEHARDEVLPEICGALKLYDHRVYGQTAISFYRYIR